MELKDAIKGIIKKNSDKFTFAGGAERSRVNELETSLGVQLPESYKWFLENYGHGGVAPVEILGIAKSSLPPCKRVTDNIRNYKLPKEYVIIEDCGEYYHCLDTSRMDEFGECPVINWDMIEGDGIEYENFLEFLYDRFSSRVL